MNALVPVALFGWIVVVLALFMVLRPLRAVIYSFVLGWLFLPQAGLALPAVPDLTKITATSFGALLGAVIFDFGRVLRFRPSLVDAPMAAWCLVPFASSIQNGYGAYDGLAGVLDQFAIWGAPYLVGRLYLTDFAALRELALAIIIGGLLYVPLCLLEIRLSPQLHRWVYGTHAHSFAQTMRWGGYRPTVFMQHGLMVGLWMTGAALIAYWCWRARAIASIAKIPMSVVAGVLILTALLVKSTGALALLIGGLALVEFLRATRGGALGRLAVIALVAIAPAYLALRISGQWEGAQIADAATMLNEERGRSVAGRFAMETKMVDHAMARPAFGWGSWDAWRVKDEMGRDITVADSLWSIAISKYGLIGVSSLVASLVLPALLLLSRVPLRAWSSPAVAPGASLAVMLVLYMIDSLLNAMLNPVFVLAAGGIVALWGRVPELRRAAMAQTQQAREARARAGRAA